MRAFASIFAICSLASCSATHATEVRFCNPEDHGKISIQKDLTAYRLFGLHNPNDGVSKKIENCSDDANICLRGPFLITIDRAAFGKANSLGKEFPIITRFNDEIDTVKYSKDRGVLMIMKEVSVNDEGRPPPLIFIRCGEDVSKDLKLDSL